MAMTGTWEKKWESGDVRVRDKNRNNRIIDQRDRNQAKKENRSKEKTVINSGKMAWILVTRRTGLSTSKSASLASRLHLGVCRGCSRSPVNSKCWNLRIQ